MENIKCKVQSENLQTPIQPRKTNTAGRSESYFFLAAESLGVSVL